MPTPCLACGGCWRPCDARRTRFYKKPKKPAFLKGPKAFEKRRFCRFGMAPAQPPCRLSVRLLSFASSSRLVTISTWPPSSYRSRRVLSSRLL